VSPEAQGRARAGRRGVGSGPHIRFSDAVVGGEPAVRVDTVRERRSRSARQKRGTTPRACPRSARHQPSAYSSSMRTFSPTAMVSSSAMLGANVCATAMLRGRRRGSRSAAEPVDDAEDERRTWLAACWCANEDVRAGVAGGGDASDCAALGVSGVSASHVDLSASAPDCAPLPGRYAGGGVVTSGAGVIMIAAGAGASGSVARRTGAQGRTWGTHVASGTGAGTLRTTVCGRLASRSSDQPKREPLLVLLRCFSLCVPSCWARLRTLQAQTLHPTSPANRCERFVCAVVGRAYPG
jgi:hypothetical protein